MPISFHVESWSAFAESRLYKECEDRKGNYLNIGNDGFASIIKGSYVDKTGMISFFNNILGTKMKLVCVSRPRRFGKSYAIQMLSAYYDRNCDSSILFENLKIADMDSFEEHLNQYDVINLDMTLMIASAGDVKKVMHYIEEKLLREVREAYPQARQADTVIESLANVTSDTGNRFIVLIDE